MFAIRFFKFCCRMFLQKYFFSSFFFIIFSDSSFRCVELWGPFKRCNSPDLFLHHTYRRAEHVLVSLACPALVEVQHFAQAAHNIFLPKNRSRAKNFLCAAETADKDRLSKLTSHSGFVVPTGHTARLYGSENPIGVSPLPVVFLSSLASLAKRRTVHLPLILFGLIYRLRCRETRTRSCNKKRDFKL